MAPLRHWDRAPGANRLGSSPSRWPDWDRAPALTGWQPLTDWDRAPAASLIGIEPQPLTDWDRVPAGKRGQGRIELPTSPTLKENHTTRPLALSYALTWARTRDLSVNSRALCQLSHEGVKQ